MMDNTTCRRQRLELGRIMLEQDECGDEVALLSRLKCRPGRLDAPIIVTVVDGITWRTRLCKSVDRSFSSNLDSSRASNLNPCDNLNWLAKHDNAAWFTEKRQRIQRSMLVRGILPPATATPATTCL